MNEYVELIKEIFHPDPYAKIEENIEGSLLHLSRESVNQSKYILLVNNFDPNNDLKIKIKSQKSRLKSYYGATITKGVGVIEIFMGKYSEWSNKIDEVKPDWHGLQSIILQGLLFIDVDEKKYQLKQSQWGPIKFGNFQGQMDKVHYLLGKIGAT